MQQIVLENKLPLVNLVESGGANLLYQAEIFVDARRMHLFDPATQENLTVGL